MGRSNILAAMHRDKFWIELMCCTQSRRRGMLRYVGRFRDVSRSPDIANHASTVSIDSPQALAKQASWTLRPVGVRSVSDWLPQWTLHLARHVHALTGLKNTPA